MVYLPGAGFRSAVRSKCRHMIQPPAARMTAATIGMTILRRAAAFFMVLFSEAGTANGCEIPPIKYL